MYASIIITVAIGWLLITGCKREDCIGYLAGKIYIANKEPGTISVIDPEASEVIGTIALPSGCTPHGLRMPGG